MDDRSPVSTQNPSDILIISSSLNPDSHSRILAEETRRYLHSMSVHSGLLDLRHYPLPLCDARDAYDHHHLPELNEQIGGVTTVLLAMPVYNFDVSAAVKNLIELTGNAWKDKITGFLLASGGASSYMSVMGFANSLMLDFRCLVIPRFVYATREHFHEGRIVSPEIPARIQELADQAVKLTHALAPPTRP